MNIIRQALLGAALLLAATASQACETRPGSIPELVRCTPYSASFKFTRNMRQIRGWILHQKGYCTQKDRHIFFDVNGEFLGYIDDKNPDDKAAVQAQIDETRGKMLHDGRTKYVIAGDEKNPGYPFAWSCNPKETNMNLALRRYLGDEKDARVYGSWKGLEIGSRRKPVPLRTVFQEVFEQRNYPGLTRSDMSWLAGKLLIESGGNPKATSNVGAVGLMQIMPPVLQECGVSKGEFRNPIAQVDCAFWLYSRNKTYLKPYFERTFGHLPDLKRNELFQRLLVQAYHGGIGNVRKMLNPEEGEAGEVAAWFAERHKSFSAEEISTAMVFHNYARLPFGMASIRYVTDVSIARDDIITATRKP